MPHLTVIIDPELDMEDIPDWMGESKLKWISTSSSSEMRVVYNFYVSDVTVFGPGDLDWLEIPYDDYCVSVFNGKPSNVIDPYMYMTETRQIAFIKNNVDRSYVVLIPKSKR